MFTGNQIYREAATLVALTAPRATTKVVEFTLLCAIAFAGGGLLAFAVAAMLPVAV